MTRREESLAGISSNIGSIGFDFWGLTDPFKSLSAALVKITPWVMGGGVAIALIWSMGNRNKYKQLPSPK